MTKAFPLAVVGLGILMPSAQAIDYNIKSSLSETVEINDNRKLLSDPAGNSYNSISSLVFDARAFTATSSLHFNGNLSYRAYSGPGEDTTLNALDNGVSARFEKSTRLTTYNVMASRRETETSTLQLLETGVSTLEGSTIVSTVAGGFKHQLGPRDSIAWQTSYTTTEFTSTGGSPFNSLTTTAELKHRVSPLTDLTPSLQFQQLTSDTSTQNFWKAMMGMQTQLTSLLSLKAAAGATVLDSEQKSTTTTAAATTSTGGSDIGWVADMALVYKLKTGQIALTAARTNGPTSFGQFQESDTVGLALSHTINHSSSLLVSGSFSRLSSSTASASELISAFVTYSRTLVRDLHGQITYKYIQRNDDTSTARSNAILLVLRRDVTVLP